MADNYISAPPEPPKPEAAEGQHPDPKGKMKSFAPGYEEGPDGASVEKETPPAEEAPKTE